MKQLLILSLLAIVYFGCSSDDPEPFDAEAQLETEMELIAQYLEDNNIMAELHDSGISFVVNDPGTGDTATLQNTVEVTYEGRFLDGSVFDEGTAVSFRLNQLITGWQIGIPLIGEGGSITLYMPSLYAYGPIGIPGAIPENATLIFDIDLLSVQ